MKSLITLETLAASIDNLSQKMERGFQDVDSRFHKLENRMLDLESHMFYLEGNQRETLKKLDRVERLEGNQLAMEADIKELYGMVAAH